FDLREKGLPALDRAARIVPPSDAAGKSRHLSIQHRRRAASFLPPMRRRVVLYPALGPGQDRCERAMPGWSRSLEAAPSKVRRPQLGSRARRTRPLLFARKLRTVGRWRGWA